jgi:prepilin-type N-terminal cleavage/methylation domain-containing protein/prepilin-type processing-associated H-X9-DG protein
MHRWNTPYLSTANSPLSYKRRRLRAFTLIELLTGIALIGILTAILIPTITSVRNRSLSTQAVSNVRQVGLAALMYANDHGGTIPGLGNAIGGDGMGLEGRLFPYITSRPVRDWADLMRTYREIRDPAVPFEISKGGHNWGWTGAANALFNQHPSPSTPDVLPPARRLSEFDNPSNLIYASSGSGSFLPQHGIDPAQLPLPAQGERRGIYFAHNGAAPAVFLDGSAQMLRFPIDPTWINPNFVQ